MPDLDLPSGEQHPSAHAQPGAHAKPHLRTLSERLVSARHFSPGHPGRPRYESGHCATHVTGGGSDRAGGEPIAIRSVPLLGPAIRSASSAGSSAAPGPTRNRFAGARGGGNDRSCDRNGRLRDAGIPKETGLGGIRAMRNIRRGIGLVGAALILATCTGRPPARIEPVRLGALYPLSGPQGPYGMQELRGVETALELFNARGGLRGRPVELDVESAPDVETAWRSAHRLARSGVSAIIGSYGSTLSLAASEAAHREGVLYWETGAVADLVTSRRYPEVFRTGPSGATLAAQAARFATQILAPRFGLEPGALKIAVVYGDDPYGSSIDEGIRAESTRLGFRLAGSHPYDPATEDFTGIVDSLARARPDVVVAATYLHDGARFRDAVLRARLPIKALIGKCAAFYTQAMAQLLGPKIDGVFVADKPQGLAPAALTAEGRRLDESLRLRYLHRHGSLPDAASYMGFSGAWTLLAHVLPRARSFALADLQKAALDLDLPEGSLPNGSGVRFAGPADAMAGQNLRALGVVWQWQRGKPVLVYPGAAAHGEVELASR